MWNSLKSVRLSLICTKAVIVLVIACAVLMPEIIERYMHYALMPEIIEKYEEYALMPVDISGLYPLMATLYLCCVPAMAALICLHTLLSNIKKGSVFITRNVKLLRAISWCCFAAAFILVFAAVYYTLLGLIAVALAFIGLILRVVKNVIDEAVRIKSENDFTI